MGDTCQICGELIEDRGDKVEVVWTWEHHRRMGPYHADCIKDAIRLVPVEVPNEQP